MTRKLRLPLLGRFSLFWTLFIGIGAVAGKAMMWFGAEFFGMSPLLPMMQVLPFADVFFQTFLWPGVFLLLINGVTQLTAAGLIWNRHRFAPVATLICGVILMAWTVLQFFIFSFNPVSALYCLFGFAEAVMAILWFRSREKPQSNS